MVAALTNPCLLHTESVSYFWMLSLVSERLVKLALQTTHGIRADSVAGRWLI